MSLCKCCFPFSFFFARQCECPYAHEICLPAWADSGSPLGHICDHRLLPTLWWLEAQSRLPCLWLSSLIPVSHRATEQNTAQVFLRRPALNSAPPQVSKVLSTLGDQKYIFFSLGKKKNHFGNIRSRHETTKSAAESMPGL